MFMAMVATINVSVEYIYIGCDMQCIFIIFINETVNPCVALGENICVYPVILKAYYIYIFLVYFNL